MLLFNSFIINSQESAANSFEINNQDEAILLNLLIPAFNIGDNISFDEKDAEINSDQYAAYVSLDYQRLLTDKFNITLSPFFSVQRRVSHVYENSASSISILKYLIPGPSKIVLIEYTTTYRYRLKIGGEWRIFGTGLQGVYVGVYPSLGFMTVKYDSEYEDFYTELGLSVLGGYQWTFNNGFTIKAGAGIGHNWLILNSGAGNGDPSVDIFSFPGVFALDVFLGYAF
jgi:opacity protein-like surface antigen